MSTSQDSWRSELTTFLSKNVCYFLLLSIHTQFFLSFTFPHCNSYEQTPCLLRYVHFSILSDQPSAATTPRLVTQIAARVPSTKERIVCPNGVEKKAPQFHTESQSHVPSHENKYIKIIQIQNMRNGLSRKVSTCKAYRLFCSCCGFAGDSAVAYKPPSVVISPS